MTRQLSENVLKTDRHETFYLACGPEDGPLVIFCHGWPELSITWRQQLEALGATGVRAIAPDMRGYGRSTVHPNKEDYRIEDIVNDMVELLDHLGAEKAVWVGHDLGAPVMWSIAQQFPERCHGMIGICVPYLPNALTLGSLVATVDRELYPVEQFPNGQWDYIAFYQDHFDLATKAFDADPKNTVHALFRAGEPSMMTMPSLTATTSARGGWFGPNGMGPPLFPLDTRVLSNDEAAVYIDALGRNGFTAPDSWYVNLASNAAYAEKAKASWRLMMPVMFVHATYDPICATSNPALTAPMREYCADLSEVTIESGHWVAQEKADDLNAAIRAWLTEKIPAVYV